MFDDIVGVLGSIGGLFTEDRASVLQRGNRIAVDKIKREVLPILETQGIAKAVSKLDSFIASEYHKKTVEGSPNSHAISDKKISVYEQYKNELLNKTKSTTSNANTITSTKEVPTPIKATKESNNMIFLIIGAFILLKGKLRF